MHIRNDFLIEQNISRSAFFLKVTFHFRFLEAVVGLLKSDLFNLVGYNFVRKPDDRWKEIFKGFKMRPSAIFFLFWLRSYGLSKVHYFMVVVGFGTFRPFHFGWL